MLPDFACFSSVWHLGRSVCIVRVLAPVAMHRLRPSETSPTFGYNSTMGCMNRLQLIEYIERMHIPNPTPDNHIITTFASSGAGT
jgi:hypothetical protein